MSKPNPKPLIEFLRLLGDETLPVLKLKDLTKHTGVSVESSDIAISFLRLFNLIEELESDQIKVKSSLARNFILSLSLYIEQQLPLISNWDRPGLPEQESADSFLKWGNHFLHYMEKRRVQELDNDTFLRNEEVVVIVIKAQVHDSSKSHYLYQFNGKSLLYKMIGGLKHGGAEELKIAVMRILEKELPQAKINADQISLTQFAEKLEMTNISIKTGLYTHFNVRVVHLKLANVRKLKLKPIDKWVSLDEIMAAQTEDGMPLLPITDNIKDGGKQLLEWMKSLPNSLAEVQEPTSQIKAAKGGKQGSHKSELLTLLAGDEDEHLEFKSSVRWDYHQNTLNKGLEKAIIKSVAGFLNSSGGTLLIGVDDDKKILGIERDMSTLNRQNQDGFSQFLVSIFGAAFGIEYLSNIQTHYAKPDEHVVALVKVTPAVQPVFVREGDNRLFFCRAGNTTRQLNAEEAFNYIQMHW